VGWLRPALQGLGAACVVNGAGTQRQFRRLAFILNFREIRQRIHHQLQDMLDDVRRLGPADAHGAPVQMNAVKVVVMTSLCGGAGSGMLLDTAYLVRDILRTNPVFRGLATKQVTVIAVMPSVFQALLHDGMFRRLQQTAYAALLEMEHYGTRWTDADMFLGPGRHWEQDRNRVGFLAPWKHDPSHRPPPCPRRRD